MTDAPRDAPAHPDTLVSRLEPASVPQIEDLWTAMADGLTIQRFGLHADQVTALARDGARADGIVGTPLVRSVCRPWVPNEADVARLDAGGLGWTAVLPRTTDLRDAVDGWTVTPPDVHGLVGTVVDAEVSALARLVAEAARWWVAFFAGIRHDGLHYETLHDCTDQVAPAVLDRAADYLTVGWTLRAARRLLLADPAAPHPPTVVASLTSTVCNSVAAAVRLEGGLRELQAELGELRLVELVTTAFPSRDQFTKYRAGTGPGQVE